jgi:hypothetical protein
MSILRPICAATLILPQCSTYWVQSLWLVPKKACIFWIETESEHTTAQAQHGMMSTCKPVVLMPVTNVAVQARDAQCCSQQLNWSITPAGCNLLYCNPTTPGILPFSFYNPTTAKVTKAEQHTSTGQKQTGPATNMPVDQTNKHRTATWLHSSPGYCSKVVSICWAV